MPATQSQMTDVAKLLIAALGGSGVAILAIALVALKNPDKIQIWVTWVWKGARLVTRRAEYGLIGQDVSAQLNLHIGRELREQIDGFSAPSIRIRWDNTAEALTSEVAGTLIVRMRPHEDRVTNLLHAALAATPRCVVPTLRSKLTDVQAEGIDLQLCRRLAQSISASALTKYSLDIRDPAITKSPGLDVMLERLNSVDLGGLFIPIFLQELTKLDALFPADRLPHLDSEVDDLLRFLLNVAERGAGEDVNLTFIGQRIRINIMLVARRETRAKGIGPYRSRVTMELAKGVDTTYVLATETNIVFADEVVAALDADRRLIRHRRKSLKIDRNGRLVDAIVVPFERNTGFATSEYFADTVRSANLRSGLRTQATVIDVQDNYAMVDISGVTGVIRAAEADWGWVEDCRNYFSIGDDIEVEIQTINNDGLEVVASRKACLPNPVANVVDSDIVGTAVRMRVTAVVAGSNDRPDFLVGIAYPSGLPTRLNGNEFDWGANETRFLPDVVGAEYDVVVLRVLRDIGALSVSHKRLAGDQWNIIRDKYPRDRNLVVMVQAVDHAGAHCEIETGLSGFVPADEFRQAGFEYTDFETTLKPGQALRVYVRNVVAGQRQRITLGLQINKVRRV